MKTFIVTLVIICIVATAGTIIYLNHQKMPTAPAPVVESSPRQTDITPPTTIVVTKQEPPRPILENAIETAQVPTENTTSGDLKPAIASTPHSKAVDILVSAQTSFSDRQAMLNKLKNLGELDAAIAELKQRVADNPNDAETQIALGEAIMKKFPIQNYSEAAMLGLQIDQSFNAALKLDPANWEAQFSKAAALAGWPAEMNTGPEVIQRLSGLIDQQDTMTPKPEFAQAYVLLGEQYQKAGQSDYAAATWGLGLKKFPNDPALQKKIASL